MTNSENRIVVEFNKNLTVFWVMFAIILVVGVMLAIANDMGWWDLGWRYWYNVVGFSIGIIIMVFWEVPNRLKYKTTLTDSGIIPHGMEDVIPWSEIIHVEYEEKTRWFRFPPLGSAIGIGMKNWREAMKFAAEKLPAWVFTYEAQEKIKKMGISLK